MQFKSAILPCQKYFGCHPGHNELYSTDGELVYMVCNDCGLIWRSPESMHIKKDYGQPYFDSKKYSEKRRHKVNKSGWLLDIARRFKPGIAEMLEIGCSLGYTLEAAAKRGINALGTDISGYAVNYCRNLGFNAENITVEKIIEEQKSFDLVFMQHVLEHFPDPFEILQKCHRLLNPGGLVLIMVPNSEYRNARKKKAQHRFYSIDGVGAEHYVYFNYRNLRQMQEISGFKVLQQNYPFFVKGKYNPVFFLNRIFRRSLSMVGSDQEILVIAEKAKVTNQGT